MLKRAVIACAAILTVASGASGAVVTYVLQTPGVV
jgi:hypothetical protein